MICFMAPLSQNKIAVLAGTGAIATVAAAGFLALRTSSMATAIPRSNAENAAPVAAAAVWMAEKRPLFWHPLGEPGSGGWITGLRISPHNGRRMLVSGDMLGIGLSVDSGQTWQATLGLKSYEIGDLTWHPRDPNLVWAGTMSGPYISRDGGKTWEERRNGFPAASDGMYTAPVERIMFDPRNEKHLLALGGSSRHWGSPGNPLWGGLWESHNGGETWRRLTTLTRAGASADPMVTGTNIVSGAFAPGSSDVLFVALSGGGIWKSIDGGKTWAKASSGLPHDSVERVITHPRNPNVVWAALGNHKLQGAETCLPGGIYKSTDAGKTWSSISKGLSRKADKDENFTARYKGFAVCEADPNVMYTADTAWNTGDLYVTQDGGKQWRLAATKRNIGNDNGDAFRQAAVQVETAYPAGLAGTVFAVDPSNPNIAFCTGSEHFVVTRNGGKTWEDGGNVRVGDNAWAGRGFSGLCSMNFRFNPQKPDDALLLGMDAGKLWRSRDGLRSWTFHGQEPWPWGGGNDAVYAKQHIYATFSQHGGFAGIRHTADGGATWVTLLGDAHGLPAMNARAEADGIYARPDQPEQVWSVIGGQLYHSANAGAKWAVVHPGPKLGWIAADPRDPATFYISGEKNVLRTTDGGKTFTPIGGPHSAGRIACDRDGRVYVNANQGQRGGLWRWDGKSWTRLLEDTWVQTVAVDPTDATRIAVTTNSNPYTDHTRATGIWISADGGTTWRTANDGLAMLRGHALAFNPHNPEQLVFGSFGRGFFVARWPKGYLPATTAKSYTSTEEDARFASIDATPFISPSVPTAVAAALVVRNGAMTEASGELPTGWDQKWVGKGQIKVVRDTRVYHTAPASLRVESSGGAAQGQASQVVEAAAGAKFVLKGYLKTEGQAKVNVALQPYDGAWSPITFLQARFSQNDTEWTPFEKEFTLPQKTARFGIVLLLEGEGKAWLDEVSIAPAPH